MQAGVLVSEWTDTKLQAGNIIPGPHMSQSWFERCRLRPWMLYLGATVLIVAAWDSDAPGWMIARALGFTCFFAGDYLAERRTRAATSGDGLWQVRPLLFAIFCALLTTAFLIAYLLDVLTGS